MVAEISTKNELLQEIAKSVRDFANLHIRPNVMEWDESQTFPVEIFRKLGELGLMGVLVPEQYGGAGLGYKEYVTAIVELSKVDPSIGLSMAAHNSLCTNHILMFGNEEQKAKYLPKLATGEWIGAWGLTEPNTGSDASNMRTTAVQDGDYYIINGAKRTRKAMKLSGLIPNTTPKFKFRGSEEMIFLMCYKNFITTRSKVVLRF